MPNIDGLKLIRHLNANWGGHRCPMCGLGPWEAGNTVQEIREYIGGGGILVGGAVVPVVAVTCKNCGYTALVNAIIAGVMDRSGQIIPPVDAPAPDASTVPTGGPEQQ
jgi:hypothetical protein